MTTYNLDGNNKKIRQIKRKDGERNTEIGIETVKDGGPGDIGIRNEKEDEEIRFV